jgi:hypothetical protein
MAFPVTATIGILRVASSPLNILRHRPEQTALFSIVAEHYPRFVQEIERSGGHLPEFVRQEFEDYLQFGLLEHGFLRVKCDGPAPPFVGFGRSDKPSQRSDYSYKKHVQWMKDWIDKAGLKDITLLGQDWGGLIGLRLLAENPNLLKSSLLHLLFQANSCLQGENHRAAELIAADPLNVGFPQTIPLPGGPALW